VLVPPRSSVVVIVVPVFVPVGLGEDQLAVRARRRARAVDVELEQLGRHGALTFRTPTIASRVTRVASSCSDIASVPAGRSGSTK
jgi:hypothetical protein